MEYAAGHALSAAPTPGRGLGPIRKIKAVAVLLRTGATVFRACATETGKITFGFVTRARAHALATPLPLTHRGVVPATRLRRPAPGEFDAMNQVWDVWVPDGRARVCGEARLAGADLLVEIIVTAALREGNNT